MTGLAIDPLPRELRARRQWVPWRRELGRDGKPTKMPYRPGASRKKASSTDPSSWGTVEEACAAQQATGADGVMFALSAQDPYCGIDLDDCVAEGVVHPAALAIVRELDSYTELSPSRTGLHVIVRGELPGQRHRTGRTAWGGNFEVYDRDRFLCMVGGGAGVIAERQEQLQMLVTRMLPPAPPAPAQRSSGHVDVDDRELLDRAFAARNGAKVRALYQGDTSAHGGDHSAADLALCSALAFWTGPDPERIDALFRGSGLIRPKWDSPRGESTYGRRTIATALGQRTRTAA